jgi:hypothetical protein
LCKQGANPLRKIRWRVDLQPRLGILVGAIDSLQDFNACLRRSPSVGEFVLGRDDLLNAAIEQRGLDDVDQLLGGNTNPIKK